VETTISRIVRDTHLAKRVKELHNHECQICGHTIILADGSRYAEGHHVQPLGAPHDGPDVLDNIVCLCPNHHAACDLGAIRLALDELRPAHGHKVGQQYIEYHNSAIYGVSGASAANTLVHQ
jgi:predicted restriction endonuclease